MRANKLLLGQINNLAKEKGSALATVLVVMLVIGVLGAGLITLMPSETQLSVHQKESIKAFEIAEAGINYYMWHLAHNPTDYSGDGRHEYKDSHGNVVGAYTLTITPPAPGETTIKVKSVGQSVTEPNIKRTIEAVLGIPTFADYAFMTNSDVWFGDTENTQGKVHSNGGIRFDGTCNALVTSAKQTYTAQPIHGVSPPTQKPGIWGTGGPQNLWMFPVPAVDFNGITADLANLKTTAQNEGLYFPHIPRPGETGYEGTPYHGYHIHIMPNGTIQVWRVRQVRYVWGYNGSRWVYEGNDIQTESYLGTYNIPSNGVIFVEDTVWVNGNVNGSRLTIASARFPDTPATNTSIIINGHIKYASYDGSCVVGLIAQKDILIPRYSPSSLEVDAALLAQKGHCFRYYYPSNILNRITIRGSVTSNGIWTWSWVNSGGQVVSGYRETVTIYDTNLTFAPPPAYPTIGQYAILSWKEVK